MKSATAFSNCERDFILRTIVEGKRLDGRHTYDYRGLKVSFGLARGSCQVQLGNTRVFAQVSCEVAVPNPSRPSEGQLFVNVELSPMAAPNFEAGRMSEFGREINRLIERCIVNSRAVDLESLCIVTGEKTWAIRVDIHVLNHDGNIVDCVSIAAIAALSHFRRPDVTISGEQVTIHSLEDRQPVPLTVHHMPICVTFAFFEDGKYLIVDPTEREENVMAGKMVVAMNIYREICMLHLGGTMSLTKDQIFRCTQIASSKAIEIVDEIKRALAVDIQQRSENRHEIGFVQLLKEESIITSKRASATIKVILDDNDEADADVNVIGKRTAQESLEQLTANTKVSVQGLGTASIGGGGASTWATEPDDDDSDEDSNDDDSDVEDSTRCVAVSRKNAGPLQTKIGDECPSGDSSSEEETIVILNSADTKP